MTGIIDYGAGNIRSVETALRYIGEDVIVTKEKARLEKCERLVLPGVGAFPAAMRELEESGLISFMKEYILQRPMLGICLGMQMLFDKSEEIEETRGLGIIGGKVVKIPDTAPKIPHMGWNETSFINASRLLNGINSGSYFYFIHSFCAKVTNRENLIATADYGAEITAIVQKGNAYGVQFHPEKSGSAGLKLLENFCKIR